MRSVSLEDEAATSLSGAAASSMNNNYNSNGGRRRVEYSGDSFFEARRRYRHKHGVGGGEGEEGEGGGLRSVLLGHNMTSVVSGYDPDAAIAGPGNFEENGWGNSISRLFRRSSFHVEGAERGETTPPIPSVILEITMADFAEFREKMGGAMNSYLLMQTAKKGSLWGDRTDLNDAPSLAGDSAMSQKQMKEKRDQMLARCFREVPESFFKQDHTLDSPAQFAAIDPDIIPDERAAQKMLTGWLDLVEYCLWDQVTSQAGAFFGALTDLKDLEKQVASALRSAQRLRKRMMHLKETKAVAPLRVVHNARRCGNMENLRRIMDSVLRVRQAQPNVSQLLSASKYEDALDVIAEARELLEGELSGINALKHTGRQLNEYEDLIGDTMSSKFIDLALSWDMLPIEVDQNQEEERDRQRNSSQLELLAPLVTGLLRFSKAAHMRGVLHVYRARVVDEVKLVAKTVVSEALVQPSSNDDAPMEKGERERQNVEQLLSMKTDAFLSFLTLVFENLDAVMQRAHDVHQNICVVAERADAQIAAGGSGSADDSKRQKKMLHRQSSSFAASRDATKAQMLQDSADVVSTVCELAQRSVKQLLTVRLEVHARLPIEEFKQLWRATLLFVVKAEGMCSKKGFELRGTLLLQGKKYLDVLHEKYMTLMHRTLNAEEWKQSEVSREFQKIIDRMGLIAEGKKSVSHSLASLSLKSTSKELVVAGKRYRLPAAALMLSKCLVGYLDLTVEFPALASTALYRLVDLISMFNVRTSKLVLGTEACATAGLNRINAKNLALASQSVQMVRDLLPTLQRSLARTLPSKHRSGLENAMKRVGDALDTHKGRIYDKFVLLVQKLADASLSNLDTTVQWDRRGNMEMLGKPQSYMTKVIKGVNDMYKVLQKQLFHEDLVAVFERIFDIFNKGIPAWFESVNPDTPTGRSRVRVDINHLLSNLRRLRVLDGPGDAVETFVKEKYGTV